MSIRPSLNNSLEMIALIPCEVGFEERTIPLSRFLGCIILTRLWLKAQKNGSLRMYSLSTMFNHPSSRHKKPNLLSSTSLCNSGSHRLRPFFLLFRSLAVTRCFSVTTPLVQCPPVNRPPPTSVTNPSETWSLTLAAVGSAVDPLQVELIACELQSDRGCLMDVACDFQWRSCDLWLILRLPETLCLR